MGLTLGSHGVGWLAKGELWGLSLNLCFPPTGPTALSGQKDKGAGRGFPAPRLPGPQDTEAPAPGDLGRNARADKLLPSQTVQGRGGQCAQHPSTACASTQHRLAPEHAVRMSRRGECFPPTVSLSLLSLQDNCPPGLTFC